MRAYLFDIDGTLADLTHRLPHIQKEPKDWDSFFAACDNDIPIGYMINVCRALMEFTQVIFVSGRSDSSRGATETWLANNGLFGRLYMRTHGDHRPDHLVKADLLDRLRADGFAPIMAFDDRDAVVKMWRAKGIPCAQVADGNF